MTGIIRLLPVVLLLSACVTAPPRPGPFSSGWEAPPRRPVALLEADVPVRRTSAPSMSLSPVASIQSRYGPQIAYVGITKRYQCASTSSEQHPPGVYLSADVVIVNDVMSFATCTVSDFDKSISSAVINPFEYGMDTITSCSAQDSLPGHVAGWWRFSLNRGGGLLVRYTHLNEKGVKQPEDEWVLNCKEN